MRPNHFYNALCLALLTVFIGACSSKRTLMVPRPPMPPTPSPTENLPARLALPASILPAPEPQFDPVVAVIEQAEAAFARGEKNYLARHLEAAKLDFNAALNAFLESPVLPEENKKLQKSFDSLVSRIHSYELGALREGDGFAEPGYQPAPRDEWQSVTFADDAQADEEIASDNPGTVSDLPVVMNSQVASFVKFFSESKKGRNTIQGTMARSGRFRDMILNILEEEGVPKDLIYLAQAESGFQPRARSRAGAMGLWQFMPFRGKEYGLQRNWWMDERLNPEKATRAAARHLRDLYDQFGDWYLAMAAYNAGPVSVQRAVKKAGSTDYWKLIAKRALPKETRSYVPIILAMTIVGKNPDKYGLDFSNMEPAWLFDTVIVDHPVDLRLVAEMVGTSFETIRDLNPSLLRMTTPNVPEYEIRIPLATKDAFLKKVAMIPAEKRVYWRWHTVRHGESLTSIAKEFKTSVKAIAEVNNIDSQQQLQEAAELIIPVTGGPQNLAPISGEGTHRIEPGETLSIIARRYGVTVAQLMMWNELDGSMIRAGSRLIVGETAPEPQAEPVVASDGTYQVRRGDTLGKIAQRHRITVAQLMTWNNMNSTVIHPGGTLIVRGSTAGTQRETLASTSSTRQTSNGSQVVHRVRRGESLWQIASNYNTTVEVLKRSNAHLNGVLRVGDRVVIPSAR